MKDICIVTRTHPLLDGYIAGLTARGIRTYEIRRSKLDDPGYEGVRMATMHRVKGLEFRHGAFCCSYRLYVNKKAASQIDK